nr:MAG TPA: hypothetical protein [Caudoviricetes sp.]
MMYLFTCPRGNSIGIFKMPIKLMAFEIGYSPEAIRTLIDRFMNKYGRITYDYEVQEIAIHHALKYTINKGGKPMEEMIERMLKDVSSLDLINKVYASMKEWWQLSKRDIDQKIMGLFESEIKIRESILNTNTNTNTDTHTDSVHDSEECDDFNTSSKNNSPDTYSDTGSDSYTDTQGGYSQILSAWNSLDKNIPKIKSLNAGTDRHKLTKARINEYGIEAVLSAIRSIDDSQFLKGYKTDFVINYDWFIRPNNFVKVRDGNYIDRSNPNSYRSDSRYSEADTDISDLEAKLDRISKL